MSQFQRPQPIRQYQSGERLEVWSFIFKRWEPATVIGYRRPPWRKSGQELLYVIRDGDNDDEVGYVPDSSNFREGGYQLSLF